MNIPNSFDGQIHFHWDTEYQWMAVHYKKMEMEKYVYLGSADVKVDFDNKSAITESIAALKKAIDKVRLDAEQQVNGIEQKIQSLLAIEYNGDSDD